MYVFFQEDKEGGEDQQAQKQNPEANAEAPQAFLIFAIFLLFLIK